MTACDTHRMVGPFFGAPELNRRWRVDAETSITRPGSHACGQVTFVAIQAVAPGGFVRLPDVLGFEPGQPVLTWLGDCPNSALKTLLKWAASTKPHRAAMAAIGRPACTGSIRSRLQCCSRRWRIQLATVVPCSLNRPCRCRVDT